MFAKNMATVKATIKKNEKRIDGTWNVVIRITHNRKSYYMRTSMFVEKKDLTSSFKIKNQKILDRCREIEHDIRQKISVLNLELSNVDIVQIISHLEKSKNDNNIDFVKFCHSWIEKNNNKKGINNYKTAIKAFISFIGRDKIFFNEITSKTLKLFEEHLSKKKRAQSLYPSSIMKIYNDARDYYNDEDLGIIRIKNNVRFKAKKQNIAEKRSLPESIIKQLFKLPYTGKRFNNRHDLAKDCFMLSFCLMGINSVDLFNAREYDGEHLIYYRTKTKDRRKTDNAKMVVKVHPFIKPIFEKYYDGSKYVFNFYKRFSNESTFNASINKGLKEIAEELKIPTLQFYYARHSFATIAVNRARINKYVVNDMLCHVDKTMKITDLYIEKDYSVINDANDKLIKYMFLG